MTNENEKCASCSKESKNLRKCTSCKSVYYCNRDCQLRDWKKHKKVCKDQFKIVHNAITTPFQDRPANTAPTESRPQVEFSKGMRKAFRNGDCIMTVSQTSQGLVMPGMPLPEGVPTSFHLKQEAQLCLSTGPSGDKTNSATGNRKLGNLQYEKAYREYYDDIVMNEMEWLTFFDHPLNSAHAEHTCGILGTLATIYRQRGGDTNYTICGEILDMEEKVLDRYKLSIQNSREKSALQCYDGLEYKYHVIRFNLLFKNKNMINDSIPLFRKLLDYEIRNNCDWDNQNFLWMLSIINLPPTPASVRKLSKIQCLKLLNEVKLMDSSSIGAKEEEIGQARVALMKCASCNSTESAINEYKACARCGKVFYCKKSCQKSHWKSHKKVCNK